MFSLCASTVAESFSRYCSEKFFLLCDTCFFFFKCKSSFKDVFFLFSYHVERRRPTYDDVVREVVCAWGSGLSTRSLIEYMRFFRDFFTEDYKRYSSTIRDCGRVKLAKRP